MATDRRENENLTYDKKTHVSLCVCSSGAIEVELDKQGRINIPQNLRKYANLTKECTVIGVSNRIEIWDRETWNEFYEESEESFEDIAEDLIDFDF